MPLNRATRVSNVAAFVTAGGWLAVPQVASTPQTEADTYRVGVPPASCRFRLQCNADVMGGPQNLKPGGRDAIPQVMARSMWEGPVAHWVNDSTDPMG